MNDGIQRTGIASAEELRACPGIPGNDRFEKGPVAVIECVQEIPCNPCEYACSSGAISVGLPITRLPVLDGEKCIGCGECLAFCPGLAVFLVHKNFTDTTSLVEFPYEYLPLPEAGAIVPCGGRDGRYIADGKVVRVIRTRRSDGTALILVEVPKEFFMDIRTICRKRAGHDA
ncbi:MAG: 4Fe-4S binding protein [Spirochaetaceae bacterium]|nr:4Fe-4S binding protein [Spirochaetaceae bacterium]